MVRTAALIIGVFLIVSGVGGWLLLDAICVVDSDPTARVLRGDLDTAQLHSLQFTPWREPSARIRPFVSWLESFEKGKIIRYRQSSRADHLLIRQMYYEAEYLMPDGKMIIGPASGPVPYAAPNSRVLLVVIGIGVVMLVLAVVHSRKVRVSQGGSNIGGETITAEEPGRIAGTKQAGHTLWYVLDIVVIAILFGCMTFVHSSYLVRYVGGLHNRALFMFDPYIWYLALAMALGGICLVILLIRVAVTWPARIHSRKRLWGLGLSVVLSLVAYASLHFVHLPGEYDQPFLLGYRKHVRTHVDIAAIRAWLDTQDPNTYGSARIVLNGLTDEQRAGLPPAITSLKPYWVEFFLDAHGHWAIRLDWGHVNDDWGVEIGRPDMEAPATQLTDEAGRPLSYPVYRLPLAPGAYVWHKPH